MFCPSKRKKQTKKSLLFLPHFMSSAQIKGHRIIFRTALPLYEQRDSFL